MGVQLLLKLSQYTHLIVYFYRYSSNRQELNCYSNCHAPQMYTPQNKTIVEKGHYGDDKFLWSVAKICFVCFFVVGDS